MKCRLKCHSCGNKFIASGLKIAEPISGTVIIRQCNEKFCDCCKRAACPSCKESHISIWSEITE